jgi:hypothetical protein
MAEQREGRAPHVAGAVKIEIVLVEKIYLVEKFA